LWRPEELADVLGEFEGRSKILPVKGELETNGIVVFDHPPDSFRRWRVTSR
jgi:hypothetical protein